MLNSIKEGCFLLNEELYDLAEYVYKVKAETQKIEVKAAHQGCPRRLYDTLSSFSNQDGGGILLFGMNEEDGFSPIGVYDLHDLQKKVTEQCNQMIPPVRAIFTSVEWRGVTICSAEIPSIDIAQRPCFYAGSGKYKGSYVRVGDADLPMTDYEIYSYEAFRKHVHDDERLIDRADLSYLNKEELDSYVMRMKQDRPGFSRLSREQIYELLSIARKGVPTLASLLNFGVYPQGFLPQLAIVGVVVPGTHIGNLSEDGSRFLDNKRMEGTLASMLEEALLFCRRNMRINTRIDPASGQRQDVTEYPLNAIREAVLNALIHRDYSAYTEGTPIQLYFYTDRLEIHSPGGLYGRMTVEELGHARPDLRNPALATMSEFLLRTENRYSGIPTMYREMKEYNLPAPVFENRRNEFVVIFYNHKERQEEVSLQGQVDGKDLLKYCESPKSRQEIANFLGIKTIHYVTKNFIQPLLEDEKLQMTIPNKPKSRLQKYYTKK